MKSRRFRSLLSRFQLAADGKTAYERLKGKIYRGELVDYGEKVMFMPIVHGGKMKKLETKWSFGRFCGIRPRSNEMLIVTSGRMGGLEGAPRGPQAGKAQVARRGPDSNFRRAASTTTRCT